jgi:hypothetical protein
MNVNQILGKARRNARISMLNGLILIGLGFVALYFSGSIQYLQAQSAETLELRQREVLELEVSDIPLYKVNIDGDEVVSGIDYRSEGVGFISFLRTETTYNALYINERILLLETTGEISDRVTEYTGLLLPLSDKIQTDVINPALEENNFLKQADFLPMVFTTVHEPWQVGIVTSGVMIVIGSILLLNGLSKSVFAGGDPIYKQLKYYGDVKGTAEEVVNDLNRRDNQVGKLRFGDKWVFGDMGKTFFIAPYADLVWHYVGKNEKGKPVIFVYNRNGSRGEMPTTELDSPRQTAELERKAPWAFSGFNMNIFEAVQFAPQRLAQAVDERKQASNR